MTDDGPVSVKLTEWWWWCYRRDSGDAKGVGVVVVTNEVIEIMLEKMVGVVIIKNEVEEEIRVG